MFIFLFCGFQPLQRATFHPCATMRQSTCKGDDASLRSFNGDQPNSRAVCLLRLSRSPDTVNHAPFGFPSNSRPTLQSLAGQNGLMLSSSCLLAVTSRNRAGSSPCNYVGHSQGANLPPLCRVLNCERTLTPPSNVYTSLKDEKNLLGMGYVCLLPTL